MPVNNTNAGTNELTVNTDGNYLVSYSVSGTPANAATITVELLGGGTAVAGASNSQTLTTSAPVVIGGQIITALTAGETLALQITSSVANTFALSSGTNAYLTAERLG